MISSESKGSDREQAQALFGRSEQAAATLSRCVPQLVELLPDGGLESECAWNALAENPASYPNLNGVPVMVAALVGPSGAGKSTLFTLLTGVEVPAGDYVRPISHSSIVAAPPEWLGGNALQGLFPGYKDHRLLGQGDELRNPKLGADVLFHIASRETIGHAALLLALADIPDFNTVEKGNWDKAQKMMKRADLVLFMVYPEGYKDQRVVDILRRCCLQAGAMAFLFAKTSRTGAERMWADLKHYTGTHPEFEQQRQDGQTLAAFMAGCPCFHSPWSEKPHLDDVHPINGTNRTLFSLLGGLEGAAILLRKRLQLLDAALRSARSVCIEARALRSRRLQEILDVEDTLTEAADRIAVGAFPMGRMLQLMVECARNTRPTWLRRTTMPLAVLASPGIRVLRSMLDLFSKIRHRKGTAGLKERAESERNWRGEEAEGLVTHWRAEYAEAAGDQLNQAACRKALDRLNQTPLPHAGSEWEEHARHLVMEWVEQRPWRCGLVGVFNDLLLAIGGAAVALDFLLIGGLGTMTTTAGAGAASMTAGALLKFFEEAGLYHHVHSAAEAWRKQRAGEFRQHLDNDFAAPLFLHAWRAHLERLSKGALEECEQACQEIERIHLEVRRGD